jgi:hypothetical protein
MFDSASSANSAADESPRRSACWSRKPPVPAAQDVFPLKLRYSPSPDQEKRPNFSPPTESRDPTRPWMCRAAFITATWSSRMISGSKRRGEAERVAASTPQFRGFQSSSIFSQGFPGMSVVETIFFAKNPPRTVDFHDGNGD